MLPSKRVVGKDAESRRILKMPVVDIFEKNIIERKVSKL